MRGLDNVSARRQHLGIQSVFALLGTLSLAAFSRADITIFNTGVDASGHVLPNGTTNDPHYTLVTVPSGTTQTLIRTSAGGYPVTGGAWLGDDTLSAWIGPNNSGGVLPPGATGQEYGPVGLFDYRTAFTLPASGGFTVSGQWAADDAGLIIAFNSVIVSPTPASTNLLNWTPFSFTGTGVQGQNTLDFYVYNLDSGFLQGQPMPGPTGLRVEITGASFVPEPASLTLVGSALLALLNRRRA